MIIDLDSLSTHENMSKFVSISWVLIQPLCAATECMQPQGVNIYFEPTVYESVWWHSLPLWDSTERASVKAWIHGNALGCGNVGWAMFLFLWSWYARPRGTAAGSDTAVQTLQCSFWRYFQRPEWALPWWATSPASDDVKHIMPSEGRALLLCPLGASDSTWPWRKIQPAPTATFMIRYCLAA